MCSGKKRNALLPGIGFEWSTEGGRAMNGLREVYVLGVGMTKFGRMKGVSPIALGVEAAKAAFADSGLSDPRMLEVAYASRSRDDTQTAENIMQYLGVTTIEMHNTENACASGGGAVNLLWKDIAYGVHDLGIVVGCESMTSMPKGLVGVAEEDLNGELGVRMPCMGAMNGRRFLYERGGSLADLAYPSIKNHRNACGNPYAQFQKVITLEDVLNARMISDPIGVLHCCPTSDGAAAVILCTKEIAMRHTTKLVRVDSSVIMTGAYESYEVGISDIPFIHNISFEAYRLAGIGPEDLDLVEMHDAFSPEELYAYEATGVCGEGECIKFIADKGPEIGGVCAFNPSGGLQSLGHPLGASGVRIMFEVTQHLRGEAGARQVQDAKVGMAQMIGGYLTGLGCPTVGSCCILTI